MVKDKILSHQYDDGTKVLASSDGTVTIAFPEGMPTKIECEDGITRLSVDFSKREFDRMVGLWNEAQKV